MLILTLNLCATRVASCSVYNRCLVKITRINCNMLTISLSKKTSTKSIQIIFLLIENRRNVRISLSKYLRFLLLKRNFLSCLEIYTLSRLEFKTRHLEIRDKRPTYLYSKIIYSTQVRNLNRR